MKRKIICMFVFCMVMVMGFGAVVQAQAASSLNLDKAKKMISAAEKKSVEINVPMVITVVDEGGNLIAQERMDGALLASIAISRGKAYTAVALKMPTETLAGLTQPTQPLFGINTIDDKIVIFGGGLPIVENGRIVGGIGVSGGSVEEDISVVTAGLSAW